MVQFLLTHVVDLLVVVIGIGVAGGGVHWVQVHPQGEKNFLWGNL